ncbi:Fe-S cluster assembly ATPase SufC [bacterium]|jgi:Fe-S cluster assembly ATP-binding protein|nr:Fe-S cluster assembly ATPase SufC [bacterium]MBT4649139.1 Fe-S cluster assembly ATPase SufC [bacterium]
MKLLLQIKNLHIAVDDREIIKGLDLEIKSGEIHIIMGPNGAGKSTLSNALLGDPSLDLKQGKIVFVDKNISDFKTEDRAKLGLFMSWQHPPEITGVSLDQFLFLAYKNIMLAQDKKWQAPSIFEFKQKLEQEAAKLEIPIKFLQRSLNVGFSGGEKKKIEMLQLAILEPKLAILDETDSGLDVDAIKLLHQAIKEFKVKDRAVLLITHHPNILDYIKPDYVHIMIDGQIVKSGSQDLIKEVQKAGFKSYVQS